MILVQSQPPGGSATLWEGKSKKKSVSRENNVYTDIGPKRKKKTTKIIIGKGLLLTYDSGSRVWGIRCWATSDKKRIVADDIGQGS